MTKWRKWNESLNGGGKEKVYAMEEMAAMGQRQQMAPERTDKRTGKEAQRQEGLGSECRVGGGVRYGRPKDATG